MPTELIYVYTGFATNITFHLYHSINLTAMLVRTFSILTAILCSTNSTNTVYIEVTFMQLIFKCILNVSPFVVYKCYGSCF